MRSDRLLTLALVRPARHALAWLTPAGNNGSGRLPILMYHSISDDAETHLHPYFRLCTAPARFAEQMQWLADWGYRGVSLSEALRGDSAAARKQVAITFDDGFRDFHAAAFPVLHRHGFTATMYVPTAFIGREPKSFLSRPCLSWSEVRELRAAGMEFGSHTVNHPRLVELDWPAIEQELRESKKNLEQELQEKIDSFAYPYGFPQADAEFSSRFRALLDAEGYASGVTTIIGSAQAGDDRRLLPRLPANSLDDATLLSAKLRGDYDWMQWPQTATKRMNRWLRRGKRPRSARAAAH